MKKGKLFKKQAERLQSAIDLHREKVPRELKEKEDAFGRYLYIQQQATRDVNTCMAWVDMYRKRVKALETITPETFCEDYFDPYFHNCTLTTDLEFVSEMLNENIIEGYLLEKHKHDSHKMAIVEQLVYLLRES